MSRGEAYLPYKILTLFWSGLNTCQIARQLNFEEATVEKLLHFAREQNREEKRRQRAQHTRRREKPKI